MNFLKLTELFLTTQGNVVEKTIYVNPQHIKEFYRVYQENFQMDLTKIYWAMNVFNATNVKETPEEINHQLIAC
jgi:hypothetical protein